MDLDLKGAFESEFKFWFGVKKFEIHQWHLEITNQSTNQ